MSFRIFGNNLGWRSFIALAPVFFGTDLMVEVFHDRGTTCGFITNQKSWANIGPSFLAQSPPPPLSLSGPGVLCRLTWRKHFITLGSLNYHIWRRDKTVRHMIILTTKVSDIETCIELIVLILFRVIRVRRWRFCVLPIMVFSPCQASLALPCLKFSSALFYILFWLFWPCFNTLCSSFSLYTNHPEQMPASFCSSTFLGLLSPRACCLDKPKFLWMVWHSLHKT